MPRLIGSTLFLLCSIAAASPVAAEVVLTAPRSPSAGQATSLVFSAPALGFDLNPATQPVVSVAGSSIRIDLNAECDQIFCDAIQETLFRTELPALNQGSYSVRVFATAQSSTSVGTFDFVVGPAASVTSRRPAEGAWSNQSRPGTGLYLQHRGPLLSVAQFDFDGGSPRWRLDVAPLRGDSALLLLRDHSAGSCFDCDPHQAPSARLGGTPLLITFPNARRARAELADGSVIPLVSLPFGADYVPFAMPDSADAEFGELPLPDLSGTWAYDDTVISFGPAQIISDRQVRFPEVGQSNREMICTSRPDAVAGCVLAIVRSVITPVPPIAIAEHGDIEENRIRMRRNTGADRGVFYMVRIPQDD